VDRYDLETVGAMLVTAIGIAFNLAYLQADAYFGAARGELVLVPILAGLAVALSGVVAVLRRTRGEMVIVDRIWAGSLAYLTLSAGCSALFQPRFG
jgi:hypothetical protein